MKVAPENLIYDKYDFKKNKNFFLITGNEETYIGKIVELILLGLKKNTFEEVRFLNNSEVLSKAIKEDGVSLFSAKKIYIFKNLKEIDLENLDKNTSENNAIIIVDPKIKNTSKIKKYFDSNSGLTSITCYKLNKENKKRMMDYYFFKENIKLQKEAYWYFLDRCDDRYIIFENEIKKIINYNKKDMPLRDVILLLSSEKNEGFDKIFFLILAGNSEIIIQTQKTITTPSESFLLMQKVKFYFDLYLKSENLEEANSNLPKYMFMEKEKYLSVYKKLTSRKLSNIFSLIKKAEIMLRKHSIMHVSITQRFLINLKKTIG